MYNHNYHFAIQNQNLTIHHYQCVHQADSKKASLESYSFHTDSNNLERLTKSYLNKKSGPAIAERQR